MKNSSSEFTTLLFDLGGVLIELGSLAPILETSEQSSETVWENWLHNPHVREFESGQCSEQAFARAMIHDLSLSLDESTFLEHFRAWPVGVYAGADQLLAKLSQRYQTVCLSNTNQTHFDDFLSKQSLLDHFEIGFFSHQTGRLKPDPVAFEQVIEHLSLPPGEILFFDDNPHNVKAARDIGLQAEAVNTPDGILSALKDMGVHV